MVASGVHAMKSYVHSDCGDDDVTHGDVALLRWTAHCALGTILRFHGADHRPWKFSTATNTSTEDFIRQYLDMRYKLMPSIIAAGHQATETTFPLAVRLDLFWPENASASDNSSYLFLNDTLVAPIFDMQSLTSTRNVWVPPGQWQDAWSGKIVTGPITLANEQPFNRIPMYHRRGAIVVTTSQPGLRVEQQDWSVLTLEAFPQSCTNEQAARKKVYERTPSGGTEASTSIDMSVDCHGVDTDSMNVSIRIANTMSASRSRGWTVRFHLLPAQTVVGATLDGAALSPAHVRTSHIEPLPAHQHMDYFPFGGAGSPPAPYAGRVAEFHLDKADAGDGSAFRTVRVDIRA
jgi:hypothetical protein